MLINLFINFIGPSDYEEIFRKARSEYRVILTTSKNMKLRSSCPEAMLVKHQNNLEKSLIEILDRYNIELEKDKFLTICGKCGGNIITCEGEVYYEIVRKKKEIIENRVINGNNSNNNNNNDNNCNINNCNDNIDNNQKQQEEQQQEKQQEQQNKEEKDLKDFVEDEEEDEKQEQEQEGIHWVPQDRQIFMCEKCDQVNFTLN